MIFYWEFFYSIILVSLEKNPFNAGYNFLIPDIFPLTSAPVPDPVLLFIFTRVFYSQPLPPEIKATPHPTAAGCPLHSPDLLRSCLFCRIIFCLKDFIHPPFIAGCGAEHAAHQMILPICMRKSMQCIVLIYSEFFTGDKDCSLMFREKYCSHRLRPLLFLLLPPHLSPAPVITFYII